MTLAVETLLNKTTLWSFASDSASISEYSVVPVDIIPTEHIDDVKNLVFHRKLGRLMTGKSGDEYTSEAITGIYVKLRKTLEQAYMASGQAISRPLFVAEASQYQEEVARRVFGMDTEERERVSALWLKFNTKLPDDDAQLAADISEFSVRELGAMLASVGVVFRMGDDDLVKQGLSSFFLNGKNNHHISPDLFGEVRGLLGI